MHIYTLSTLFPSSVSAFAKDKSSVAFLANKTAKAALENTLKPSQINTEDYSAIFYAGGHGPMFDLPDNKDIAILARKIYEENKGVVGAVCHGPAGLVPIILSDGTPIVKGRTLTCFTNAEEDAVKLTDAMPFLLETKLKELGAKISTGAAWSNVVKVDGKLVTGQNPASASDTAKAVVQAIHS
eukprot:gb/GEZN01011789.1/.p1 GENE.gb/GEZN01011789.1/~~gb/GEZN01011789.1/.p1  ORF type:complete len:184 (-),score=31.29 gb/GEZN01011789.1/:142-693(-)